ncbi:MAG: cyclopropane-fatty-acyl-phospholipid synthase family protein [Acidobacteriota bacterium]|nr:cyclopropane-fatty-acyl-phospholipid synthase family protein [Blastocatellia bacterium]MDW8412781.1 cyclopropane-fatty-acyl-phospholipid synthase family protein [Acidobacteriota bacterium]
MEKNLVNVAAIPVRGVYEALVHQAFSGMKRGQLRMTLPSGAVVVYGSGAQGPLAAIKVNREEFFRKCVLYGDIGFGEAYVDGDWDSDDIVAVISWFIANIDSAPTLSGGRNLLWGNLLRFVNRLGHQLRRNTLVGARRNIKAHYDLSNELFELFLDPSMTYSCARFEGSITELEAAQKCKYETMCRKLKLRPEHHLLEIGCGWGGFAIYAAGNYGCQITAITISEQQYEYAVRRVQEAGLDSRVRILLCDYREVKGEFDRIVSIEMLEAVGHKYLSSFFRKCHELLKKDGILGLQVIICPDSRYKSLRRGVDWIQKHIFPGSLLPSIAAINKAINDTGDMYLHGLEEMGLHYAKTLATWRDNFNANLPDIYSLGFNEKFVRKWNYYFSYCEAAFRMRNINVVQMIYSRPNNLGI